MDLIIRGDEEDTIRRLYEASMEGSVDTLNLLIQNDPLILSKISLAPFSETPLHVSASFSHLDFTKQLLSMKPQGPKLAMELDRFKRSPLHLASAEGHTDIVQALIQVNDGRMCLASDQDGKIPLHFAAMRGRVEVIKLLIGSQSQSIFKKLNESGETVLHLCVQYNQLETLKILVDKVGYENNEFLNSKDQNGNTILHLAVMLKQVEFRKLGSKHLNAKSKLYYKGLPSCFFLKLLNDCCLRTIEYMLSLPGVKTGATALNQRGLKASDLVEHLPKDFKSLKIQNAFQDVSFQREKQQYNHLRQPAASSIEGATTSLWSKFYGLLHKYDRDWIKDKTGALLIVATLIATLTYQTAINPPGGVWQESRNNTFDCTAEKNCTAGTAVLANIWVDDYLRFLVFNSMAFISSVVIIFLLISGFPVRYRPCMWIFNIFICSDLTFLTLTFREGMYLVSPLIIDGVAFFIFKLLIYIWGIFIGLMILLQIIRILIWIAKNFLKTFKCMRNAQRASGNHNSNNAAHV